ncbi:MAG TPA: 2Fe-2S iron-sulfur cluster binding domain-containing protein, partial [Chloroflexi bacterium]|nr:2Fe-2S iron-sulfur cluster binding domain-containing protein [Chloroflexota bacterium]
MIAKAKTRKNVIAWTLNLEPVGRRGECQKDKSLLACARQLGVGINSICGGEGTCHSCKVQVLSGTVSKPTPNEREAFNSQELKDGWRLACQAYPAGDCKIAVPADSMTMLQRVQVEGLEVKV